MKKDLTNAPYYRTPNVFKELYSRQLKIAMNISMCPE